MFFITVVFLSLFGLCVGSFANVCIYRIPKGKSVVTPRSFCPHCRHQIAWYDNIPFISYIILRGHCRHCREEIPWQYPVVELLTGLLSVAIYFKVGTIPEYFVYFLLLAVPLIIVSFIDIHHMLIPDLISLPGIVAGIAAHVIFSRQGSLTAAYESALGVILGGGLLFLVGFLYQRVRKVEGIGGGDVKLIAMIGAFLGVNSILFVLILSSFFGVLVGIILHLAYKKDLKTAVPYGPFLSLAALIYFFYGREILSWYFNLMVF